MTLRFAFAGFRHGHIFSLYQKVAEEHKDLTVYAACESDPAARAEAERQGVRFTHDDMTAMIRNPETDVVAVGDAYGRRGAIVLEALKAGKHVISDKPFCISLEELDEIEEAARRNRRSVGCMFDLRTKGNFRTALRAIREGRIGDVRSVQFNGMHPLNYGKRPGWYFEPGMHGGTINDIAIHAFDLLPHLTGSPVKRILASFARNSGFPEVPHFSNAGALMLEMENGACVTGDVSYFAPSFASPAYWRFTVSGTLGMIEFNINTPGVLVMLRSGTSETLPPDPPGGPDYFDAFLGEIAGRSDVSPSTEENLRTARWALTAQKQALT